MASSVSDLLSAADLRVLELEQSQSVWQSGDTEEQALYSLLKPMFADGSVYPDTAHAQREYPDVVYSMSDAGATGYRGVDVSHSVVFGLSIRHTNRADLAEKSREVATSLHAQSGVAILGRASAYEEALQCYVMAMEVLSTSPIGFDSSSEQPFALLVLPGKEVAQEPTHDNCGTQIVHREHHIIYHADSIESLEAQRDSVQQAVHWKQLDPSWRPVLFKTGEPLPADGGLVAWVDVWTDSRRLRPD